MALRRHHSRAMRSGCAGALSVTAPARAWPSLLGVLALLALSSAFAQTSAGTLIVNQAQATVGDDVVVRSNQVMTVVQVVCGVALAPHATADEPAQRLTTVHGNTTTVAFTAVNTGNASASFEVAWHAAVQAWRPSAVRFYRDVDHTGRRDPGDPQLDGHVTIPAGASAALVMEVDAPLDQSGRLLITPQLRCAHQHDGDASSDGSTLGATSYAEIVLSAIDAPAVNARMAFTTPVPSADGSRFATSVHIDVSNVGALTAGATHLLVPLDQAPSGCFRFAPERTDPGIESLEVQVAGRWLTYAAFLAALDDGTLTPDDATALRFRRASLASNEVTRVTVGLELVTDACPPRVTFSSTLTSAHGSSTTATHAVAATVLAPNAENRLAWSDPLDAPLTLSVGATRCVEAVLRNTGRVDDVLDLRLDHDLPAAFSGALATSLTSLSGLPLPTPFDLDTGASRVVRVCVVASQELPPFALTVRATSARGAPPVAVSVAFGASTPAPTLELSLRADPAPVLRAGATVRFEVTLRNAGDDDAHDLRGRFDLLTVTGPDGAPIAQPFAWHSGDAGLSFDADRGTVRWIAPTLTADSERSWSFTLRVRDDAPDGARIDSVASVRVAQADDPAVSGVLSHTIWSSQLLAVVSVVPDVVDAGGEATVRVVLRNPSSEPLDVQVEDRPHVSVVPVEARVSDAADGEATGSSDVTGCDQPSRCRAHLDGGETVTLEFVGRVAIGAATQLPGNVRVDASTIDGVAVSDDVIAYAVVVDPGVFQRDRGLLIGHVFSDTRDDGRYDPHAGHGLQGVRLILADGRQAITDAAGRFVFTDLPVGAWRVQIDPATLPAALRATPTMVGPSAHRVLVQGVSRLDVPVDVIAAALHVERESLRRFGPLTLVQREAPLGGMWLRVIELETSEPLADVVIRWDDDSARSWHVGPLDAHARLAFVIPAGAPFVDPEVVWRPE